MRPSISTDKQAGLWRSILKIVKDFDKHNIHLNGLFQITDDNDPGHSNQWRWALGNSGIYTVASLRKTFDDVFLPKGNQTAFQWVKLVPDKVNILAWKISHKRIPTKSNLSKRGVQCIDDLCTFCGEVLEDEDHIFRGCVFSSKILSSIGKWWEIDVSQVQSLEDLLRWGDINGIKGDKIQILLAVIYSFFWFTWKARNDKTFRRDRNWCSDSIFCQVQNFSFFWCKNKSNQSLIDLTWSNWICNPFFCS